MRIISHVSPVLGALDTFCHHGVVNTKARSFKLLLQYPFRMNLVGASANAFGHPRLDRGMLGHDEMAVFSGSVMLHDCPLTPDTENTGSSHH